MFRYSRSKTKMMFYFVLSVFTVILCSTLIFVSNVIIIIIFTVVIVTSSLITLLENIYFNLH